MSLFGDRTFKQEVYDTLHYIIYDFKPEILDRKEQLKFIHDNIFILSMANTTKLINGYWITQKSAI